MLDQIAAAFDRQDYRTAAQLLQQLRSQSPQDPWVQFYSGRLQEVSEQLEAAAVIYRQLLRETLNPKLATQARQGIQRIEEIQRSRRQATIAQVTAQPQSNELGALVLEAVTGTARTAAIQNFARVMTVDAYTARLLLPNRGWRLYRVGAIGELQRYGQALQAAGVPACWAAFAAVQKLQVFRVHYFQTLSSQITVVCENAQNQLGYLTFAATEVSQRVIGMVPIFEQVVELGYRDRLERREETQDYSHLCDLHLPERGCILRLHDNHYDFDQGVRVFSQPEARMDSDLSTLRTQWNALLEQLQQQLAHAPTWSEFTLFGETAADFAVPLNRLTSHIRILRQQESYWDAAFQLYSSFVFLRQERG